MKKIIIAIIASLLLVTAGLGAVQNSRYTTGSNANHPQNLEFGWVPYSTIMLRH